MFVGVEPLEWHSTTQSVGVRLSSTFCTATLKKMNIQVLPYERRLCSSRLQNIFNFKQLEIFKYCVILIEILCYNYILLRVKRHNKSL